MSALAWCVSASPLYDMKLLFSRTREPSGRYPLSQLCLLVHVAPRRQPGRAVHLLRGALSGNSRSASAWRSPTSRPSASHRRDPSASQLVMPPHYGAAG